MSLTFEKGFAYHLYRVLTWNHLIVQAMQYDGGALDFLHLLEVVKSLFEDHVNDTTTYLSSYIVYRFDWANQDE